MDHDTGRILEVTLAMKKSAQAWPRTMSGTYWALINIVNCWHITLTYKASPGLCLNNNTSHFIEYE